MDKLIVNINGQLNGIIHEINREIFGIASRVKATISYNGHAIENDILYVDYLLTTDLQENEPISLNIPIGEKPVSHYINIFAKRFLTPDKPTEKKEVKAEKKRR